MTFYKCKSLETVMIPEGVTNIGQKYCAIAEFKGVL